MTNSLIFDRAACERETAICSSGRGGGRQEAAGVRIEKAFALPRLGSERGAPCAEYLGHCSVDTHRRQRLPRQKQTMLRLSTHTHTHTLSTHTAHTHMHSSLLYS